MNKERLLPSLKPRKKQEEKTPLDYKEATNVKEV